MKKNMKQILAAIAVLLSISVYGQQLKLTDAETDNPVQDAFVYSANGEVTAYSDARGVVNLEAFQNSDSIFIRQLGYELATVSLAYLKQNDFKFQLTPSAITGEEVVIAASKWEQSRRELSAHVATVTKRDAELLNPQTAADLLTLSGAVFVQKSQLGGGSPMLRGFSTNRVLLVVDGVRMNTSIFRAGNVQNALRLDANNIEAAEVVFGPGSLIYGSDAIGGVMDYHTLTPKFSNTGKAQVTGHALARFASANLEKAGHLDINIGLKSVAFLTSFTYSDYDDLRMGSNGGPAGYLRSQYQKTHISYDSLGQKTVLDTFYNNPNPLVQKGSGFSQWNLVQKVRIQAKRYHQLTAAFHISRSSNVPRYDRLTDFTSPTEPRFSEWYYGPEQWMMAHIQYLYSKPNPAFNSMKLNVAYQQNNESRNDRRYRNRWLRRQNETVHAVTVNADFSKDFNEKYSLFYGVEAVFNRNISFADRLDVRADTTQRYTPRYPNANWQSYAAYVTARLKFSEKVIMNAGVRYNHFLVDAVFDTSLIKLPFAEAHNNFGAATGSVGLTFLPTPTWKMFLNFTTGFRAPNIDDIGKLFESAPGVLVVPNKSVKPEYALNTELGIEKRFGKLATVYVGAYYNYLLNALTLAPFQLNGSDSLYFDGQNNALRAIQNSSNAFVAGVQATARFDFGKGFGAFVSYNYQYGREKLLVDGEYEMYPMRHVAPMFGTAHITYRHKWLTIDLYGDFSGKINSDNLAIRTLENPTLFPTDELGNYYSPAWYTLNLKTAFDVAKYLTLTVGIENITDQRYRTYSSGIAASGVNALVGLRGKF
jgi:hemoglobin/transferrin/lactoferrin receptor protein